ncbi:hypothetical protein [Fodinicola feengrottensis]|uniref:hypothetical protein n=1 Tax=Fodinicola feengrottensis TaxID=435914 RepID=UPI0013D0298F|nr:hypothetical protein [Fodinicola feengrottensis]
MTLTFLLCEEKAVTDFPVDVGVDTIETVGLDVHNPGFESAAGWTLSSTGGVKATVRAG